MGWDFHTYQVIPTCLEPFACLAFFGLFVGCGILWVKYMQWSLGIGGKGKDQEE